MARPSPQTERVVAVINLLIAHTGEGLTLSEIARRLRVNKVTCYPMLMALTDAGFLTRHPTRRVFNLGPALISAGHAAAERNAALDAARIAMTELADELDLTCLIVAMEPDQLRVIDQAWHSRRDIPYLHIGQTIPLRPPAGATFMAWSDAAAVGRWLSWSRGGRAEKDYFEAQLAAIRADGYAIRLQASANESWRRMAAELKRTVSLEERRRIVDLLQSEMARQSEPLLLKIDNRRKYAVADIEAPIFDASGHACATLILTNLPPLTGKQVRTLAQRLQATASRVSLAPPRAAGGALNDPGIVRHPSRAGRTAPKGSFRVRGDHDEHASG